MVKIVYDDKKINNNNNKSKDGNNNNKLLRQDIYAQVKPSNSLE